MASYRRVTYEDRCQIHALLQVNIGVSKMAQELRFHRSTIFREIKRNRKAQYYPQSAQMNARRRYLRCRRTRRGSYFPQGKSASD